MCWCQKKMATALYQTDRIAVCVLSEYLKMIGPGATLELQKMVHVYLYMCVWMCRCNMSMSDCVNEMKMLAI